ncbi:MAG: response regulator [Acidaminococcaceae bacterium]
MEKLRIILADDEALIRLDVKEMLLEAGHDVVAEACNGEEAVALTRSLRPDFVIMDVKMPQMDGLTAAKIIAEESLAPVLLLTAYSQTEIVAAAKTAGVLAYLVKPVKEQQLFPAMEIALSRFTEFKALDEELNTLKESLETRKLLERAKGLIMTAHGLTEDEAYRKLQQYSMNRRLTLKALAQAVIAAATKQ